MRVTRHSKFWRLAIGLIGLGLGQRLLLTGVLEPWTKDRSPSLVLSLLSVLLLMLGLVFTVPIAKYFYRANRSDKRLMKTILGYLITSLLLGVVIGGLGQLIYDQSHFTYEDVKNSMHIVSTFLQGLLKVILFYCLVSIHRKRPMRGWKKELLLPAVVTLGVISISLVITNKLPQSADFILSLVDTGLLMTILYYFLYMNQKEKLNETTP